MTKGEGPDSFVSLTNAWSYGCFQPRSQGLLDDFQNWKVEKTLGARLGCFSKVIVLPWQPKRQKGARDST